MPPKRVRSNIECFFFSKIGISGRRFYLCVKCVGGQSNPLQKLVQLLHCAKQSELNRKMCDAIHTIILYGNFSNFI